MKQLLHFQMLVCWFFFFNFKKNLKK